MSRILGIDPGSRITGFGVVERHGGRVVYVASGCIRAGSGAFAGRLKTIYDGLHQVVTEYCPAEVALERVFMHRNPDSALKLGQARGAAICAVVVQGLEINEYTPAEIKQAVVGRGAAEKGQIQHMVRALLELSAVPQADAADALAIALCHAHTGSTMARVAAGRRV